MKNLEHMVRATIAMSAVAVMSGCASSGMQATGADPDHQLDQMVEIYDQSKSAGDCQEDWSENRRSVDCQRIQRQVDRINVEFPYNERALLTNALMQAEAGSRQNAQHLLDQLLNLPGSHPEAAILRSQLALQEGNATLARAVLTRQTDLTPAHPGLREAMAALNYLDGKYSEAQRNLRIASKLGAPEWRTAYHVGLVNEAQSNWADACFNYQHSMNLNPIEQTALGRLINLSDREECTWDAAGWMEKDRF